jgi:hypothetical protein
MKNYKDIFCNFWNDEFTLHQTYQCFGCDSWYGTDIHHINNKGSGGSKHKCFDYIENLASLCRKCHDLCHKDKDYNNKVRAKTLRLIADHIDG